VPIARIEKRSVTEQLATMLPEPSHSVLIDGGLRQAVYAFVFSRVKDHATADDLTQEILLRIDARISSLKNSEKLQAWVFRMARNVIADHFRSTPPCDPFDEDVPNAPITLPFTADNGLPQELAVYIQSVVSELPVKYREAIILTEFKGISQVEMARRLGISLTAAKSRTQRARAMVKQIIERCCHWETDRYGTVIDVRRRSATGLDRDTCGES